MTMISSLQGIDLNQRQQTVAAAAAPTGSFAGILGEAQSTMQKTDLDEIFARAAETYGVPVNLLKAVAKAESGFRPDVVSRCGAIGVMQLMPATARGLGVEDPYDPEQNIMGGAKYLAQKLEYYDGDVTLTLAAYNAGSGAVAKYGGVPPYPETQNYVKKVLGYMGQDITAGVKLVPGGKAAPSAEPQGALAQELGDLESLLQELPQEDYKALAARWKAELDMMIFSQLNGGKEEEDEKDNSFLPTAPTGAFF